MKRENKSAFWMMLSFIPKNNVEKGPRTACVLEVAGRVHYADQTERTADELIALAKTGGIELTKEEAETYMAELADFELDGDKLKNIAGGIFECYMRNDCMYAFDDWK